MQSAKPHEPLSLLHLCVQKLAQNLIKYGPKRVRYATLSALPRKALEELLYILVAKNALNDNVLPYALTTETHKLGLEGASQLRRCVLSTIGRSCPNLCVLDVRTCQQVDNKIVRDVLQHCERLEVLRLDGCPRISDSAFAPALWKPPLAGLLGLRELSVGKCGQITAEGLMGYVLKGAPYLRTLGLAYCHGTVTDEVACELLFQFGLQALDLSFCSQLTDAPFEAHPRSLLRELRVSSTNIGDKGIEKIAKRSPQLEVLDAGWAMKLSDAGVLGVLTHCSRLQFLCVCNTEITDKCFEAIMECRNLECLNASWCLRATAHALDILADQAAVSRPPLKRFDLDHLGAMALDSGVDAVGRLPLPLTTSPGQWASSASSLSPLPPYWLPRLPAGTPEPMLLPPAAGGDDATLQEGSNAQAPPASLKNIVALYGHALEQLLLDGIKDIAYAAALEAVASNCPVLEQLAVTLPDKDADAVLKVALSSIGANCSRLVLLRLDASSRSHKPVVDSLALPLFSRLNSLSLWCSAGSGLQDGQLETILSGRTLLQTLALRNCAVSEGLFPRWCNRDRDEALAVRQLDQVLLSSLNRSFSGTQLKPCELPESMPVRRKRQHLRNSAAVALRSVTYFSLAGAGSLSDRSCDALAELLHDAQNVDIRGCPLLSEETLRSFRKGCRFIRSVSVTMRERTLTWTALTSSVKKHRHRRRSNFTSGSSGTESN
ncbi:unnamed protein product [Durusdinium trenchii]|uniref:Uncharacterized protein n=2 Tax=Durusdinium trenchii TaxID=1381693 RepID=A0ABP0SX09_9DINO